MCPFQSMKSVYNGIARPDSHNNLVVTVVDFSLSRYYAYGPPPLKKYKEYRKELWEEVKVFRSQEKIAYLNYRSIVSRDKVPALSSETEISEY